MMIRWSCSLASLCVFYCDPITPCVCVCVNSVLREVYEQLMEIDAGVNPRSPNLSFAIADTPGCPESVCNDLFSDFL